MKVSSLRLLTGATLLAVTCGCGDLLTYSKDANREGMRQYNDGRYAQAAASFASAARQNPQQPSYEYWMGKSYAAAKSYHQSIDAYKTALLQIDHPVSNYYIADDDLRENIIDGLAKVVAQMDNSNVEIDLLLKDAAADKSASFYQTAGRIFRYRGDADSAIDQYHCAILLDPSDFAVQKELGLYLEQLSQAQAASVALRDAYQLRPGDDQVNAALRRLGVVPGPGLITRNQPIQPGNVEPTAASDVVPPTPIVPPSRN